MKIFKSLNFPLFLSCLSLIVLLTQSSCSIERIAILKDIPDTASLRYYQLAPYTAPIVKPDDILNIVIQTLDAQANSILNQGNLPVNSGAVSGGNLNQTVIAGYLVNRNGLVHMPYIGDVKVSGMTTDVIRDTIYNRISFYFKDPVVNVRFANFKVTVLGEVKNPSTFILPNEKPTVIDALGLAGDMTIFGRRDNVLLMRDNNGKKEVTRLNLDSSKVISSHYFFLRPNDVIYVEASPSKVMATDAYRNRNFAIISASLAFLTILTSRILFQ